MSETSATDPDSRAMRSKSRYLFGYNVQGMADAKHHLLVMTPPAIKGNWPPWPGRPRKN